MTALLNREIGVTTDPGFTRRRVWSTPEVRSHAIVVLTATRLYLTPPTGQPKPETLAAVESTYDVESVLGPFATVVDLSTVRRAALNLLGNTLTVEYVSGGNTTQVAIIFANAEVADGAFAKVWRRLGERYELVPHKPDPWAVARIPVAVMAGLLVATVGLALVASGFADFSSAPEARSNPFGNALAWMDWRVICSVGGVALAITQVWLYRRLTLPPSRLEVVRR